jgi:hypothetical protein
VYEPQILHHFEKFHSFSDNEEESLSLIESAFPLMFSQELAYAGINGSRPYPQDRLLMAVLNISLLIKV